MSYKIVKKNYWSETYLQINKYIDHKNIVNKELFLWKYYLLINIMSYKIVINK